MKINQITPKISFKKNLRVILQDKSVEYYNGYISDMSKILRISDKNKAALFINKDVFILNSTDEIKGDLDKEGITYEEVDGNVI